MSMGSKNYTEKRDFMRMTIDTAITLTYSEPAQELEGLCKDLSGTGISIEVDNAIPIGTECKVTIHDGYTNFSKFQAVVVVKRINSIENERYLLGASISEMI